MYGEIYVEYKLFEKMKSFIKDDLEYMLWKVLIDTIKVKLTDKTKTKSKMSWVIK
jgi:hypothetical protein